MDAHETAEQLAQIREQMARLEGVHDMKVRVLPYGGY